MQQICAGVHQTFWQWKLTSWEDFSTWCQPIETTTIKCARGLPTPKHNPTLSSDIGQYVFPIFKRLTEDDLLKHAKMLTQNANESFNSTIWRRCDKEHFAHFPDVQTAVVLSVLNFNIWSGGLAKVFLKLGINWSNTNDSFALKQANTRVRHSNRKVKGLSKWKR